MPGNKGIGTIISAGAPAMGLSAQDAACKAFKASVEAYQGTKPEDRNGTFNDFFFEALEKTKPVGTALAETIKGDDTYTAPKASESIAAVVARGTGKNAQAARRVCATNAASSGAPKSPSLTAWAKLGAAWLKAEPPNAKPVFPAGTLDNKPIEVKAPTDTYEPGKLEEFQHISRDTKVIEVGCESCGEAC
ncbi:MAG: hypothetical protein KIT84_10725 [Labilithrix sp.]|nr:hypothetical protein [Labilithrix sp.]MCW5811480.1 hypothetical protein [Labilithrix sp.]